MIVELVSFRLKEDVDRGIFLRTSDAVGDLLQGCAGFHGRSVWEVPAENSWLDIVFWDNLEAGETASNYLRHHLTGVEFINYLELMSVKIMYGDYRGSTAGASLLPNDLQTEG